jgi:hypothetical protein
MQFMLPYLNYCYIHLFDESMWMRRMKLTNQIFLLGVALIVLTFLSCNISPAINVQPVIKWLPSDTETLIAANGPFWMSNFRLAGDYKGNHEISAEDLEKHFRRWILSEFAIFENYFDRQRVVFAVEGSRHFRAPKMLGLMPYEGCTIIVFSKNQTDRFENFLTGISHQKPQIERVANQRVVILNKRREEDMWSLFLANPLGNVVVVATDKDYLQEVLERIQGKSGLRALPETLSEWRYVNQKAQFWGLRHFDKSRSKEDPTLTVFGPGHEDTQAIGIIFESSPSKEMTAKISYLSTLLSR